MENIRAVVATIRKLSSMDPSDPGVVAVVDELASLVGTPAAEPAAPAAPAAVASGDTADFLLDQLKKLHQAAEAPSKNYGRMMSITAALGRAVQIARRPQNAALRPRIAGLVEKVAGLFAEVDTAEDLDKPLEQVEKAVHGLYGDQAKNNTFYFDRRGKGHRGQ